MNDFNLRSCKIVLNVKKAKWDFKGSGRKNIRMGE